MRAQATLVFVWLVTGLGAVLGSIVGAAGGKTFLFVGACVGGLVAAPLAVWLAVRLGWLTAAEQRYASIGAIVGFIIAAPIAVLNLHTPITPVLICSLAGAGALIGAGRARSASGSRD
jgi:hypothetical protein